MTLRPQSHSCDVPRVVYDLTKRSFILRSLHKHIVIYVVNCYCLLVRELLLINVCCERAVIIRYDSDNKIILIFILPY